VIHTNFDNLGNSQSAKKNKFRYEVTANATSKNDPLWADD
jgi:hypothetical protein